MSVNSPRIDRIERNALINGGMDFAQRIGTGTVNLSGSIVMYLDRWLARYTGTYSGTPTIRREAVSPNYRGQYCMRVDGNATNSAASYEFRQRIESIHCCHLVDEGKMSVSAWIYTESATSADLRLFSADTKDVFSAVTVFPAGTQVKTITVGQWNYVTWENVAVPVAAANGIEFRIELNTMSATGSSKIHRLTQIMAAPGTTASKFAMAGRTIAEELVNCQRYYEKSFDLDVAPADLNQGRTHYTGAGLTATDVRIAVFYRVTKRTTANVAAYSDNGGTNNWAVFHVGTGPVNAAVSFETPCTQNQFALTLNSGLSVDKGAYKCIGHWVAECEL